MAGDNTIELQAGDHLKLSRNLKTSEVPGEPNLRTYSDGFNVSITRGGKSIGTKASFRHGETLVITGDAKDAVMEIPQTVSAEQKDIPHLQINSKNALKVTGGSFIVTEKSTGMAAINATAAAIAGTTLTAEPTKDTPAEKTPLILLLPPDAKMNRRTVIIERSTEGAGVEIVDPSNNDVLATVSARQSLEENKAALKVKREPKTEAPREVPAAAPPPDTKALTDADRKDAFNVLTESANKLGMYSNDEALKGFIKKHPDIAAQLEKAKNAAGEILDGGNVRKDKLKEFRDSLDSAIKSSEAIKNDFKARDTDEAGLLLRGLKKIKDEVDKKDALKISMAPSDAHNDMLAEARKAAGPLAKNDFTLAVMDYGHGGHRGQGNKAASSTESIQDASKGRNA